VIYLDCNATTPPSPGARDAALRAIHTHWANPSSPHRAGQRARAIVDEARASVANLLRATDDQIVFTSSATESITTALAAFASAGAREVICSGIEHPAVRAGAARHGLQSKAARVTPDGLLDLDHFASLAKLAREEAQTGARIGVGAVLSLVCSQTGAIQPIREASSICDAHGVTLLIDATQALGKTPVDPAQLGGAMLCASFHKFHGIKGAGLLWISSAVRMPALLAGSQERDRRGGTEAVPAIAGAGAACDEARAWLDAPGSLDGAFARQHRFERRLLDGLATRGAAVRINGPASTGAPSPGARLWTTTSCTLDALPAEVAVMALSQREVMVGAGTACSSGSIEPPAALLAMGMPESEAERTIRISACRETREDELDLAATIIARTLAPEAPPARAP